MSNILEDLGIRSIRLMTNNPRKVATLEKLGVRIDGTHPVHRQGESLQPGVPRGEGRADEALPGRELVLLGPLGTDIRRRGHEGAREGEA